MSHSVVPEDKRELVGITNNLVRLSIGLEDVEDLIADIDQSLNQIFDKNKLQRSNTIIWTDCPNKVTRTDIVIDFRGGAHHMCEN